MCKNLKIKFIITIIAIMFLALVIPLFINNSLAASWKESGVKKDIDGIYTSVDWGSGATFGPNKTIYIGSTFFENDFVFCIQHGQGLHFSKRDTNGNYILDKNGERIPGAIGYEVSKKYTIDGSKDDTLNGLAYILSSKESKRNSSFMGNYQNDPVQLALWRYLKYNYEDINEALKLEGEFIFPAQKNISVDNDNEWIIGKASDGTTIGGKDGNRKKGL